MGVLIAYLYFFRFECFEKKFEAYRRQLLAFAFFGLLWTPFIEPLPSFFAKTIGFTLLYMSFGSILTFFLMEKNINTLLDKIFTQKIVNMVSLIGYCSYSIYIIHTFAIYLSTKVFINFQLYEANFSAYLFFVTAASLSILAGILMTYRVEKYFLQIRNKYYPSRI
ncbi:hypothetical protein GCM10023187_07810 [Nibrella viscosa]|uniref:Acyltransferase family protein n=2 Tax=Nibrella viscosa TaxID=1084524 RepID=A0ABP8JYA1_9BACT